MVAPYNYSIDVPNPLAGFLQGMQIGQAQRQQQEAQQQQQLERQRAAQQAQQMQSDLQDYTTAPTPQKLANLYLRYPAMKESLNSYTQTLSDADRRTTTEFATQAFGLNRSGKTEDLMGLFDRYITASENSRPELTRILRDTKDTISKIEDPAAREALIGSVLANTGKDGLDLYKNIWASNLDLDTAQIKNVVALGFKLGTPEFQAELKRQMDKVTLSRPDGTFIVGTPEEIRGVLGQGGGTIVPRVSTLEEANRLPPGTEFIGPDGKPYRVPRKGGQTASPSGTFQGQ
jgi:multidrug efflux pump subunit AcrA (membrane-fusion protein)